MEFLKEHKFADGSVLYLKHSAPQHLHSIIHWPNLYAQFYQDITDEEAIKYFDEYVSDRLSS